MDTRRKLLGGILLLLSLLNRSAQAATFGFQPAVTYNVGTAPAAIAAGDFNGDGKMDLAVMNAGNAGSSDPGSVSILIGNGDGTFKAAMNFSGCKNCADIAAGDFNADGKSDLALLRRGDPSIGDNGDVTIFISNGDGSFRKGPLITPGKNPFSIIVSDVNADHRPDLIFSLTTSNTVAVLLGNGDGTFQTPVFYAVAASPTLMSLVDFNQDGFVDLAVRRAFHTDFLLANGDGTFRTGPSLTAGNFSNIVAWADFNSDGRVDYLSYGCGIFSHSCSFGLHLGNGDGTFQLPKFFTSTVLGDVFVGDYDGDGKFDIAGPQNSTAPGEIGVLLGNGDGSFQQPVSFAVKTGLTNLQLGLASDLNRDKAPDLVTLNSDNSVSVLLNNGTDFSISASKPSPASISAGQSSSSTITVSLLNTFDNPVDLACSVQPAQAGAPTCSLSTSSVAPGPKGTATATLAISSGAAAASLSAGPLAFSWLLWPVLSLLIVGVSTRARGRRFLWGLGLAALVGLMASVACGGSQQSTALQSYTITATGRSGLSEHSVSLILEVR
jgi:FG-GAP-like repeat/FG-GAP repeat